MNITYIGLGYVGLCHSVILASFNHKVLGFDLDKEKISLLRQGVATIDEPNLQTLFSECRDNINFTSNPHDAIFENRFFYISVDTPIKENGEFDLSNLEEAFGYIAKYAQRNSAVVVRSTVPVGTIERMEKFLNENTKYKFVVIYEPVFSRQGRTIYEMLNPSRKVVGIDDKEYIPEIEQRLDEFLAKRLPMVYVSTREAEMIKLASDAFLATKVSYMSELARLCEKLDVDIDEVVNGMSLDPRIGGSCMQIGAGFSGPWLKGASSYLAYEGDKHMDSLRLQKAALAANDDQYDYLLRKIFGRFRAVQGKKIAFLGASYKGGTEDVRDSMSRKLLKLFLDRGADIQLYDALAEDNVQKIFSRHTHIKYCDYYRDALDNADFCVIMNATKEFKEISPDVFKALMRKPIVFDARNLYNPDKMDGVEYHSMGRKSVNVKK